MTTTKKTLLRILNVVIVVGLFFLVSYFVQDKISSLENSIGSGISGMVVFVFIEILAVVFAPITTLPFVPLASNLWGWVIAGILSLIGLVIGSMIAFELGRFYGERIIKKLFSLEQIEKAEKLIPHRHIFWSIVFLRVAIPADILSYALGLFSNVKRRTFFFATLLGFIPMTFIISYVGGLDLVYQIIAFLAGGIIFAVGAIIAYKRRERRK